MTLKKPGENFFPNFCKEILIVVKNRVSRTKVFST